MKICPAVQYVLALTTVVGALVLMGTVRRAEHDAPEPAAAAASAQVLVLRGHAAPPSWQAVLGTQRANARLPLVIALRAEDCFTCEDLGRQLRELRHAPKARERAVIVVTPVEDQSTVRAWLRRERIAGIPVVSVDRGFRLAESDAVPTPAVLLLDSMGAVERGIAHPQRVSNVRQRSFAAELGLLE